MDGKHDIPCFHSRSLARKHKRNLRRYFLVHAHCAKVKSAYGARKRVNVDMNNKNGNFFSLLKRRSDNGVFSGGLKRLVEFLGFCAHVPVWYVVSVQFSGNELFLADCFCFFTKRGSWVDGKFHKYRSCFALKRRFSFCAVFSPPL